MFLHPVRAPQRATLILQPTIAATWIWKTLVILLLVSCSLIANTVAAHAAEPLEGIVSPESLGSSLIVHQPVEIVFGQPMDPSSVTANLEMSPNDTAVLLYWSEDFTSLWISPAERWQIDQKYLLTLPVDALRADGTPLAERLAFSFNTQASPELASYQVRDPNSPRPQLELGVMTHRFSLEELALDSSLPTDELASEAGRDSQLVLTFSRSMNEESVEQQFTITPDVKGALAWEGSDLIFSPVDKLKPGQRYIINVAGARDVHGNILTGRTAVSFETLEAAVLNSTSPKGGAKGVEPDKVTMTFSQPMDTDAVNKAFAMLINGSDLLVPGKLNWNEASTVLTYIPDEPFAAGRRYEIRLREGAQDAEGNELIEQWAFTTKLPPPAPAAPAPIAPAVPRMPAVAPASSLGGYALNQINAARAAYGFAPLYLDAGLSGVAQAHANDQLANGYYSHVSLGGLSLTQRLAAAGIYPSISSENQCHYYSGDATWVLNWCHSAFMSEPYPGLWNHIGNILNPNWRRVGVGVASNGSHTIITWDFAN